jgi:5'-3' exoribonuclease 1
MKAVSATLDVPAGGGSWISFDAAARHMSCSMTTIAKLTGKVPFAPGHYNLGLNLRVSADNTHVLGWCRRSPQYTQWEISDKALRLLFEYRQLFPMIFDIIEHMPDSPVYGTAMLGEKASQIITGVKHWLRRQEFCSAPLVVVGTRAYSRSVVNQLDAVIRASRHTQLLLPPSAEERMFRLAHAAGLVRSIPSPALPLASQLSPEALAMGLGERLDLCSRVMNILEDGEVPFGLIGTVIAVKGSAVDVLFDTPFFSGTDLGGMCPDFRGATRERRHVLLLKEERPVILEQPRQQQLQQPHQPQQQLQQSHQQQP